MFRVLVADNRKPVVDKADRLEPRWNREWLEYAEARGLVVDRARVASPQDKGRVESGVKFTERSFFAGEQFTLGLDDAQRRAEDWCRVRAGMRVHGTTFQRPAEVFAQLEAPALLPAPEQPYRVPAWSEAKVQRDFHVRAGSAFYSVPWRLAGQQVSVRADGTLVKIYHRGQVIRTHPQRPPATPASSPPRPASACRSSPAAPARPRTAPDARAPAARRAIHLIAFHSLRTYRITSHLVSFRFAVRWHARQERTPR